MNKCARFASMVILGVLLLAPSRPALADEGPKASAPLRPLLRGALSETGALQPRAEEPTQEKPRDQPKSGSPGIMFDESNAQSPQGNFQTGPTTDRTARSATKRDANHHRGEHEANQAPHRSSRPALVSGGEQRRNRRLSMHEMGRLSPPADEHTAARIESADIAAIQPPRPPIPYYPDYPAGPPGYGYIPSSPHPGHHKALGSSDEERLSPNMCAGAFMRSGSGAFHSPSSL